MGREGRKGRKRERRGMECIGKGKEVEGGQERTPVEKSWLRPCTV